MPLQRAAGTGATAIALPGADPGRITTGVVVNADGTIFHLPTRTVHTDGRYYALVRDLAHHATFAVVSHRAAFADVTGHWAADDVNDMAARFIIMGASEAAFDPDRPATRSEFTTFIARAFGLRAAVCHKGRLPIFLSREQSMAMIVRAMRLVTSDEPGLFETEAGAILSQYTDSRAISGWARPAIAYLLEAGIVQGDPAGDVRPADSFTQAPTPS